MQMSVAMHEHINLECVGFMFTEGTHVINTTILVHTSGSHAQI